jgi:type II secretory pathway pseudopilin PulG
MQSDKHRASAEAGFSIFELIVAMTIMLVILTLASHLIAGAFSVRKREDTKSDAVADTQNALNIMSREIASAGCSLPSGLGLPTNGIVAADSNSQAVRIISNPNTNNTVRESDEDVIYSLYTDNTAVPAQRYIVRYNVNTATTTVLANRIDAMMIRYYDQKVDYTTTAGTCDITNPIKTTINPTTGVATPTAATESTDRSKAQYVVIAVCVTLPQVSTSGAPDYRAPWQVQLTSDVVLRNANLPYY